MCVSPPVSLKLLQVHPAEEVVDGVAEQHHRVVRVRHAVAAAGAAAGPGTAATAAATAATAREACALAAAAAAAVVRRPPAAASVVLLLLVRAKEGPRGVGGVPGQWQQQVR